MMTLQNQPRDLTFSKACDPTTSSSFYRRSGGSVISSTDADTHSDIACLQGSGKTLAFGLPIIQRLLAEGAGEGDGHVPRTATPPSPLRGLILLPTRELALQVTALQVSMW